MKMKGDERKKERRERYREQIKDRNKRRKAKKRLSHTASRASIVLVFIAANKMGLTSRKRAAKRRANQPRMMRCKNTTVFSIAN
jgi:hypothetical protein